MAQQTIKRPSRRASGEARTGSDAQPKAFAFPTEFGWMAICWTGRQLMRFTIGHPSAAAALASLADGNEPTDEPPAFVRQLAERLQAYSAGGDDDFRDVELDTSHLTEFQRRVVAQCRRIRPGQTLTYAQLAEKAGCPGAARAVGSTMARNRFPIVIPCHRVVGANGSLGGFSAPSGVSLKRKMLALEGAANGGKSKPR